MGFGAIMVGILIKSKLVTGTGDCNDGNTQVKLMKEHLLLSDAACSDPKGGEENDVNSYLHCFGPEAIKNLYSCIDIC
jgi:hypothetical protein